MQIETDDDAHRIASNYGPHSMPFYRLRELLVMLYTMEADPDRPTRNTLPAGVEDYMLKCLEVAAQGAVQQYASSLDLMKILLAPSADLLGLMNYPAPSSLREHWTNDEAGE